MSFYWLEPGRTSALCSSCGANIWDSGGDPDWGECFDCFSERVYQNQRPESEPVPLCDVCGIHVAVTDVNGIVVCCEECANIAEKKACTS